ncbi:MAG: ABC transporter ATP-binding protein [Nitrospiria bacterium]
MPRPEGRGYFLFTRFFVMALIELIKVSKRYPGEKKSAVAGISFKVEEGETLALLGPSGSGKTTLLRLIAGFETPESGSILLKENDVCRKGSCLPPEKRGIGMVFQDYALFPHLTVEENVAFGLRRLPQTDRTRKVHETLDMVGLHAFCRRYPHELSGGQQQRVALARALAPDPIVILLDEPFSNLDPDMCAQMRGEVSAILEKTGSTAVLVTHDHEEAFAMANHIVLLKDGYVEQSDTPEVIYHTPKSPFAADFVGQADFIPGRIKGDVILTEIGRLRNKSQFQDGTEVMVMIRPDDIDLVRKEEGHSIILDRQFRGSENLYSICLPSGQVVHSSQHALIVHPNQTKVNIRLKMSHTVAFTKEDVCAYRLA